MRLFSASLNPSVFDSTHSQVVMVLSGLAPNPDYVSGVSARGAARCVVRPVVLQPMLFDQGNRDLAVALGAGAIAPLAEHMRAAGFTNVAGEAATPRQGDPP